MGSFAISRVSDNGRNYFAVLVDGSRYYYSTRAELESAKQQAEAHALKIQDRVQSQIGRVLTDKELLRGKVDHPDKSTISQQIDLKQKWDKLFAPPPKVESEEANPFLRMLKQHEEKKLADADPKGYALRKDAEAWEQKRQAAQAQQQLEADPLYQQAVSHAKGALAALNLDPRADQSDVTEAENRLTYLQGGGSIETYVALANEAREKQVAALKAASVDNFVLAAKAQKEINDMSQPIAVVGSENVVVVETQKEGV